MTDGDWTTLPVREPTRQRVRNLRPSDAHSVDSFLNDVLDAYEGKQELSEERVREIVTAEERSEDRVRELVREEVRMEALK